MNEFKPGQKWISNAEPELGMGRVIGLEDRFVTLSFDMVEARRTYASDQAPLTRVKFNKGDRVTTVDGVVLTVSRVVEKEGLFIYQGRFQETETAVLETELDPNVRFSKPEDRLFTHQIDDNRGFNLRYRTLNHMSSLSESGARGLLGPRVSLIPHQLYIASEVAARFAPRVLLADEVGLGKTIEAGLIIHQQLQTGRSQRVLIIVPPALTFQWFVEMIRRFNLRFVVLDEDRCVQIEQDNRTEDSNGETINPFFGQQLMLCTLDLFTENPDRLDQAIDGEWDLVVVDEAHHLHWTPESTSNEYSVVELISKVSRGLLLLTATPEQLGKAGHFARLRLLDPDRFHDYDQFVADEAGYEEVATAANKLLDGTGEEKAQARAEIADMLNVDSNSVADETLIRDLLDRHGTGRVLFRNVRSSVKGFPDRLPAPVELDCPDAYKNTTSYFPESGTSGWTDVDPRVSWLIDLAGQYPGNKFLVICGHTRVAIDLEKKIRETSPIRTTVFHEDMDLVARDRAATYFAESPRGAQVMITSEIGSEGRNFQFASELVLFDLPLGPDLLEQRIGRLDRIGQQNDVTIHIPYIKDSPQERLYRWYEEGMDMFRAPNPAADSLFDELFPRFENEPIEDIIETTRQLNAERREALARGRDRLLEMHSHRPEISTTLVDEIHRFEGGKELEEYMELSFDFWGLESELLDDKVYVVRPSERMVRHDSTSIETLDHYHFPELPEEGIRITYDRDTALAREDVGFFTWENPMVQQAIDVITTNVTGNSTMIAVKHPHLPAGTLLLEVLHVIDCVAPAELMADRFLPPRVLRSVITPSLENVAHLFPWQDFAEEQVDIPPSAFHRIIDSQLQGLKQMLETARTNAETKLEELRGGARDRMTRTLNGEIARLESLREVNPLVRPEELEYLQVTRDGLRVAIDQADVRLDAIRVVVAA